MNKYLKVILVSVLFLLLFFVRAYASVLFYDPLVAYFKSDYLHKNLGDINHWRLLVNMLFRFGVNTVISLAIIWVLFQRKDYIKFSSFFFIITFTILIIIFMFLIRGNFETGYLLPFYIRRFIIHPLFLLLLLPAFYYQKLSNQ